MVAEKDILGPGSENQADRGRWLRREWLVTNGLGGYAMGTVGGQLARTYHGLLIAATTPPTRRDCLLAKVDETIIYGDRSYPLFCNEYAPGELRPRGDEQLLDFELEDGLPVWTYACADALIQKRVWMQQGANATYMQYHLARASQPLAVDLQVLAAHRDHHGGPIPTTWRSQIAGDMVWVVTEEPGGVLRLSLDTGTIGAGDGSLEDLHLASEAYRGLPARGHYRLVARATFELRPGQTATLIASTEQASDPDGNRALRRRRNYQEALLNQARLPEDAPEAIRQLVLAADQFIVNRPFSHGVHGKSVIAGYPWFTDWGRDTMISLPGLTLVTGRHDLARQILTTYAAFVSQGMLPNRFPDSGQHPEYNTVDATLWYFNAIYAYLRRTGDLSLIKVLYPTLADIIAHHQRGTRFGIGIDAADGLLSAGAAGVQLTWMDAKVDDWVVTPRRGKPIEVNALWYNALRIMAEFARTMALPEDGDRYHHLANTVARNFGKFWSRDERTWYDVIDGPHGNDSSLRPNQVFAVSLPYSPLSLRQQRQVVTLCERNLWTPYGLRSLAPDHPQYIGQYGGNRRMRDGAYHQGTVWGWLMGPFVTAHHRAFGDKARARSFLIPLLNQVHEHGIGSLSEIYDGDEPHQPRGCIAQAWTVAEVLRAWEETSSASF